MSDPRFRRLKSDPRFRSLKRHKNKVAVDSRFSSLFKKQSELGQIYLYLRRFTTQASKHWQDAWTNMGRWLSNVQDNESLRRFYRIDPETAVESSAGPDYARGEVLLESSDEEDASSKDARPSDEENEDIVVLGRDTDRLSPVSDGEDAGVNLDEDDTVDSIPQATPYYPKIASEDEQESSRGTRRIAVVDLDWDHVRATHLYKIFSSAISPIKSGKVCSVRIYPSKFGLERMAHEEKGPPLELFKKKKVADYEEDVNERTIYETGDSGEYDEDALRKYQLERLRYYYAIVECDSVQLATHLYSELQGAELERSANVLNLSFVPDDMTFDEECRDQTTSTDESTNYQPLDFTTDALRHSKVKLTWDQDDPERDRVTRRTLSLKDIDGDDFRAYIASSSDEEYEGEAKTMKKSIDRDKLRALLLEGSNHDLPEGWAGSKLNDLGDDGDVDMEVTFRPALTGGKDEDETTLGRYQRKMREKRKKRRKDLQEGIEGEPSTDDFFTRGEGEEDSDSVPRSARGKVKGGKRSESRSFSTKEELSLLVAPDRLDSEPKHFDMAAVIKAEKGARKKHKGRKKKNDNDENEVQDNFVIDVKDERFTALHEDHAFAIDPSHPNFKKTKSMSALLEERSKRKTPGDQARAASQGVTRQTLSSLVESVKRKGVTVGDSGTKRRKL
ncbi:hypothetical protein EDB83DRAFT_2503096 [Lactarius deliciosus]|nr:hypothetical protein EDB83DRAFT_2503096 [Lactarius deliciosus]